MARQQRAPLQPRASELVYDDDPEGITRPDIVPAALGYAESEASPSSNEMTVADPPLRRAPAASRTSETHRARDSTPELRSGPQQRLVSTVPPQSLASTLPPPSRVRQKLEPAPKVASRPFAHVPVAARPVVRAEPAPSAPAIAAPEAVTPPARPKKALWFFVAVALTATVAAFFGSSLGNGSLERAVGRVLGPGPGRVMIHAPSVAQTSLRPLDVVLSESPRSAPTPAVESKQAPRLRFEDLPIARPDASRKVTPRAKRTRSKAL